MESKSALRKRIAAVRDAIPQPERIAKSADIARRLTEWERFEQARTILAFLSTRSEVLTEPFIARALTSGKTVGAPRTLLGEKRLDFRRLRGSGDDLVAGPFEILEPNADAPPLDPARADIILVPGLAFDEQGYRLGYGGGFYDRLLAGLAVRAAAVGVAFEAQMIERVPREDRDLPVGWVVTEKRIITCGPAR
ncbi:MAG: 5-formyltetrahydrofolate cyclo-ligase [Armatimonadota bacterium]|nr:MAG: 5-formyltetrahydrofolate cyclo-ligase [Armatimonadota bacterium]